MDLVNESHLSKFQVAIFFVGLLRISVVDILTNFLPKHNKRFNAVPFIYTEADRQREQFSPEAPFVIFKSADNNWVFPIATSRADIGRIKTSEHDVLDSHDLSQQCTSILNDFIESTGMAVWRLGLICERIIYQQTPAAFLSHLFCKETWTQPQRPLGNLNNFEVHFHEVLDLQGVTINSWTRFKTGILPSGEETKPVVVVEQDINTLSDDKSREYHREKLSDFLDGALKIMDHSFISFFPDEVTL